MPAIVHGTNGHRRWNNWIDSWCGKSLIYDPDHKYNKPADFEGTRMTMKPKKITCKSCLRIK